MRVFDAPLSDQLVHETLRFAQHTLRGSAGVFYWIDQGERMNVAHCNGVPDGFMERYLGGMNALDPMQVPRMVAEGMRIGVLADEQKLWPVSQMSRYRAFLDTFGFADTIDLLLWDSNTAYAGIGVLKRRGDAPLAAVHTDLEALRRFLETSLRSHSRVRSLRIDSILSDGFLLTRRECEVANRLYGGASNQQIADAMGIGLATVKTYVISVFDKLGVASRTALMAYLTQLSLH
jgi:DNA-binding CsgD family transcriptional regulator